jgi:rSAM/selenodomain-associated transferase 1
LLVFARVPERGRVKTRLAAELGDERTLALYEAMLREVLGRIGASDATTEVEVMWAPTEVADGARLRAAFGERSLAMQTGETLGDRLAMAFSERFFFHRTQKIIAIGVDEPRLDRETIDHAFALLDSCEWVIGPASDGGYYLIGCRGAAYDTDIFDGVPWGTGGVYEATMAKIREWESNVAVLPERFDLDVADDLRRYAREAGAGDAIVTLLEEWELR